MSVDPDTPLLIAAKDGNVQLVKALVEMGDDVNEGDGTGVTPLHVAAHHGLKDLVEYLLKNGAIIDIKTKYKCNTPLHMASMNGHLDVVKYLIDQGAQANTANNAGGTPLHWASFNGHLHVVKCLIDHGAQIGKTYLGGETAIHAASRGGHINIVRYLMSSQARLGTGSKGAGDVSEASSAIASISLDIDADKIIHQEDYEKVTNDHIKNLSGLLGINHFEPICKVIGFDPKRGQDILEEKHSDYSASYQVMLNTWKDGKSTKDIDDLLEKAGIKLVSSYKK